MLPKIYHSTIHYYSALMMAFCLPLGKFEGFIACCLPFILLMILNWVLEGDFYNKFKIILNNKLSLLFLLFYVLHIISLAYTQNKNAGLFDIQIKLSLFIFPLMLTSRPFNANQIKNIFSAFVYGSLFSCMILLSTATYLLITAHENHFFYQNFSSILMHPSYLSMYIDVAIAWLLININSKRNQSSGKQLPNIFSVFLILFFSFIIILLSSKSGIITLLIIYAVYLFYSIFYLKKYLISFITIGVLVTSSIIIYKLVPEVTNRIDELILTMTNKNAKNQSTESSYTRLLIWKSAMPLISNNPIFGTGAGDVKGELLKEYSKNNMTYALSNALNAHNEYLQVFIGLGLVGFLLLLVNLLFPLYFATIKSNYVYIAFIVIIMINFLPESMLEAQAGTMFYGFFNSLLCFSEPIPKQHTLS